MTSIATVEKIEKDYIIVSSVRKGACGENCAICNTCTAEKVYTKAFCDIDVDVGDSVTVESNSIFTIIAMALVFIFPIALPIVFYLVLSYFGKMFSLIGVGVAIIISCFVIFGFSRSDMFLRKITPKITSIKNKK